jgi:PEP-CTERM motif
LALRLADYRFAAGDRLFLQAQGDVDNGPGGDILDTTLGVFSGSSLLPGHEQRCRVVDAIASHGPAIVSSTTYIGSRPTDIAQDFRFNKTGACVTVPVGAQVLFLAIPITLSLEFNSAIVETAGLDNFQLSAVPEPGIWALLGAGLLAVLRSARRVPACSTGAACRGCGDGRSAWLRLGLTPEALPVLSRLRGC